MRLDELQESVNTRAAIAWKSEKHRDVGSFTLDTEDYEILIEYFNVNKGLKSSGRRFDEVVQVAFQRLEGKTVHVKQFPSKHPFKVLGVVYNGIIAKLDWKTVEIVIFSAKKVSGDALETFEARSSLYERLAHNVSKRVPLSYLREKITDQNGDHFVLVRSDLKLTDEEIRDIVEQRWQEP